MEASSSTSKSRQAWSNTPGSVLYQCILPTRRRYRSCAACASWVKPDMSNPACTVVVGNSTPMSQTWCPSVKTEQRRLTVWANTEWCFQYGCRQSVDGGAHSHHPPRVL